MSETVTAVEARFPERLLHEANSLVTQGWFEDLDSVLQEALRRYLDAHRADSPGPVRPRGRGLGARWNGLKLSLPSSVTLVH